MTRGRKSRRSVGARVGDVELPPLSLSVACSDGSLAVPIGGAAEGGGGEIPLNLSIACADGTLPLTLWMMTADGGDADQFIIPFTIECTDGSVDVPIAIDCIDDGSDADDGERPDPLYFFIKCTDGDLRLLMHIY